MEVLSEEKIPSQPTPRIVDRLVAIVATLNEPQNDDFLSYLLHELDKIWCYSILMATNQWILSNLRV